MNTVRNKTVIPPGFLEKLERIHPLEFARIRDSFQSVKQYTFRINYRKISLGSLRERLAGDNIQCTELFYPPGSFILRSGFRELQDSPVYGDGLIYVQNLSSRIPALVLRPHAGECILDMCAAPGAKACQIASLAGTGVELTAIEKIRPRYYKLCSTLRSQGVDSVKVILMDGVRAGKNFSGYFDKILLDVPCSCEARFHANEPKSFAYWSERKVREMAHKQKRLIISALSCLKEGGELVYSTCTFSPEENEEVIDWALQKSFDIEAVPVELPGVSTVCGLESWQGRQFSSQIRFTARIIPDGLWEGFFVARLKKTA
ncbi:MAG: RsmB/NOP family class I SAM-dependent RNA methyltransferase [Candidatus Omnitrophica bacterium]|nr:RsmB/NOP family class I SAM-dependent RNA methyltransferase [Candidatus Omnitrophota bacterium]